MTFITTGVEKQYSDSQKLAARARLNWSAPRLTGQATVCIKHRRPLP